MNHIRNFCIIAHIDHGKSTLADRLLEVTGTVQKRDMQAQLLDSMDIERERGITIKLAPARMKHSVAGQEYELNLIDTPGHVDFSYEVSRSLAAVEGALLVVDASQGMQAQTLANLYLAVEQNLTIIPVLNKIDLPNADIEKTSREIISVIGCDKEDIILASGKTGVGVPAILDAIVARIPEPQGNPDAPVRALIFDSVYDDYRGVVAKVKIVDGSLSPTTKIKFIATQSLGEALEVGFYNPKLNATPILKTGEIGYVVTGLKEIVGVRVGDTITSAINGSSEGLPGYKPVVPMVYAGIFPKDGSQFSRLRDAMERLKLNDASLIYETEQSPALGMGFRCGLLGLLHLEIVQERFAREFKIEVVVTTPSVALTVKKTNGDVITVHSPMEYPDPTFIEETLEPWVKIDVVTPAVSQGSIMQLVQEKRGRYINTEYLAGGDMHSRVLLHFELPLSSILVDFYDRLKSISSGYASLSYDWLDEEPANIVRLEILVAEESIEALATLVPQEDAYRMGKRIVEKLKDHLPRQMFEIKLQAVIGGKIIASERLSAMRKDVTAGLYGGDITRKRKLLEKQKKGKEKMKTVGRGSVDIPPETFLAILKPDQG